MARQKINIKERLTEDEIDLSMSDLQEIPVKDIAVFTKAYSLDLSNNHIKKLPVNFATLTHLIKLDLSKNQLVELPDNFGDLIKLKHLDLYHNSIEYLPLSFSKLKALRWLDLKDNPLVPAVAKVAGSCLDAKQCQNSARDVVNFFTQIQEQVNANLEIRQREKQQQAQLQKNKVAMERKAAKKSGKQLDQKAKPKPVAPPQKQQAKKTKKGANGDKKEGKCSSCSCIRLLLVLFILSAFVLFVLTSVGCQCTKSVETLIVGWYAKGSAALPPNLQPYGLQAGETVKFVHQRTGNLTLEVVDYLKKKENLVNAYNALGELIESTLYKIKEQYKKYVS